MKYHNPVDGFTKGTKQGITVCAILLAILLGFTGFSRVDAGSPLATTLDLVLALCVAAAVVWVVGGLFELEGKFYDFSVKAGGGAALLFAILFWLEPYSGLDAMPKWPVSIELPEHETLGFIIDVIDAERRSGKGKYRLNYNNEERIIRRFRPLTVGKKAEYNGDDWSKIFELINDDAYCIDVTNNEKNIISITIDKNKVENLKDTSTEKIREDIWICK